MEQRQDGAFLLQPKKVTLEYSVSISTVCTGKLYGTSVDMQMSNILTKKGQSF